MSQPAEPAPRFAAPGQVRRGTATQLSSRDGIRQLLVVMFIVRAAISLVDAAANSGDLRPVPLVDPIAADTGAPLWPALWGVAALVAALSLARGWRLGWLFGLAVAVAYLVAGISDAALLGTGTYLLAQAAWTVVLELGVPLLALACLFSLRGRYLRPVSRVSMPVTSIERLRRRR
ncbi:MAG TPA: hypothetical protein VF763_03935 [Candidatus Limnocylindrales bacterium]